MAPIACLWFLLLALCPEAFADDSFLHHRDEAVRHYQAHKYFQAIQSLEKALGRATPREKAEAQTFLARCRSALGVELFNSGENRGAEEAFRAALLHAEDSYARFGLGFLHFVRLEDEEALGHLWEAVRLEPALSKTQKLLGLLEYRQGRVNTALGFVREACRLDPADSEARVLRTRWELESQWTGLFKERAAGGFFLRVDPALGLQRANEVERELERARRDMVEAFCLDETGRRGKARDLQRITVVLFSPERFHRATGSFHWVGGLYDGQVKFPVRPDRGDAAAQRELVSTIRHEMAHWAIREIGPECPNWLNEGLAQYFESAEPRSRAREKLRASQAARIAFKDMPARLWEIDNEEVAQMTYLEGLGFVEFLAERYKPFRLTLLLKALSSEGSLRRAFAVTYGTGLEELERNWWKSLEDGPR